MGGETEVLVIGGGIVGTSCAFYLAQAGRQVTLIEREDSICPVDASSYGNAGLITPSDVYPGPGAGRPRPGARVARSTTRARSTSSRGSMRGSPAGSCCSRRPRARRR